MIISDEISPEDFYRTVDQETNQSVFRFHPEVAQKKDFMDLITANFDIVTDKITRERFIQIIDLPLNLNIQGEFVEKYYSTVYLISLYC